MKREEDLFVSIRKDIYKNSKKSILENQMLFLRCIKHLQALSLLSSQKKILTARAKEILPLLSNNLKVLNKELPKPKVPKTIHHEKYQIHSEKRSRSSEYLHKKRSVDQELLQIQEKLNQLNSL